MEKKFEFHITKDDEKIFGENRGGEGISTHPFVYFVKFLKKHKP